MDNSSYFSPEDYKSKLRNKKIWSWVMIIVILICAYIGVFHSHRHYRFDMLQCIVIIGAFALITLYLMWFGESKWQKFKAALFVLLTGVPIAVLVIVLHNIYVARLLEGHEMHTEAIVKTLYNVTLKNSTTPYAVIVYQANGREWTQNIINKQHALTVGDTIRLVCSKVDPEIFVMAGSYKREIK